MHTEVQQFRHSQAQAGGVLSAVPASIAQAVQIRVGPKYADFALAPAAPTQVEITAAIQALPAVERAAASVSITALRAWLKSLSEALPVGSVQADPRRLENAVRAICEACGHFPAACFTTETRGEVLRRCRFFPSAAELTEILEPVAIRENAVLNAVRAIATAIPAQAVQSVRESPEEIEACRARNRAIIDQMRAEAAALRPAHERPGPKYLTVLELALTDRAEGRPITRPDKIAALAEYDRGARA